MKKDKVNVDELKENLKDIRLTLGITQFDAAERCGLHSVAIGQFETGYRVPSLQNLIKLKDGYGCSWDSLLKGL